MNDDRESIHRVTVDQDIELHERGRLEVAEFVIKRGVAAAHGLEPVKEVENHFAQRQLVLQ